MNKYFEANKKLWNEKASIHKDSKFYDLKGFIDGKTSLKYIELEELGDVKGKSILHLQCHFGQDSLSLARLGAKVVGVDFADKAVKLAKSLNEELNLDAEFVCSDIYELKENLNKKFDIVFTSYGVIGWLPDLTKWAEIISHFLKPGGVFYMVEFHPMMWMFDDEFKYFKYSYFNKEVIEEEAVGTYADKNSALSGTEYGWNHSLSEVINALINSGINIEHFNEFPFSVYDIFPENEKGEDGNYRFKKYPELLPMMYSIKAVKNEN